ncbi:MAG: hypothetical protein GC181_15085 [Bacteroidetes bacterium]|nr:hypothetical protein [Bacteroidota bacterium]
MNKITFLLLVIALFTACVSRQVEIPMNEDDIDYAKIWEPSSYKKGWWYVTGEVSDSTGKKYLIQFTIFEGHHLFHKGFASHQAVTDYTNDVHSFQEKLKRPGKNAGGDSSKVFLLSDSLVQTEKGFKLYGRNRDFSYQFDLDFQKAMALHGSIGMISMGHPEKQKQNSLYVSYTNLFAHGYLVNNNGDSTEVTGTMWYDRQFGNFKEMYWYWYSIRLNDYREIMIFHFPKSQYTIVEEIDGKGNVRHVTNYEFSVSDSIQKNKKYFPVSATLKLPDQNITYTIKNRNTNSFNANKIGPLYWEGVCDVEVNGLKTGYCVTEITGKRRR